MTIKTIWHDAQGRVKGVDRGDSQASLPEYTQALADTAVVGEITLEHVVTVQDGHVISATHQPPEPPPPTVEDLVLYARRLARDKVQAALGIGADGDDVLVLSEQLRRNAVATARLSRLEKGQGRQDDRAALDGLEPMANAIEPLDAARDAIIAEITDPADPQNPRFTTTAQIDAAAEWP